MHERFIYEMDNRIPYAITDNSLNIFYANISFNELMEEHMLHSAFALFTNESVEKIQNELSMLNKEQMVTVQVEMNGSGKEPIPSILSLARMKDDNITIILFDLYTMYEQYQQFYFEREKKKTIIEIEGDAIFEYLDETQEFLLYLPTSEQKIYFFRDKLSVFMQEKITNNEIAPQDIPAFYDFCEDLRNHKENFNYQISNKIMTKGDFMETSRITGRTLYDLKNNAVTVGIWNLYNEVTNSKQEQMLEDIYLDPLTGVMNKLDIEEYANQLFERNLKEKVHLCIVDIDNFKQVNDSYGHLFGDKVLKEAASVLKRSLGKKGTPARIGGDEFLLILEHVRDEKELRNILRVIKNGFQWIYPDKLAPIHFGVSMGIATFPQDGENYESLFRIADNALYLAKAQGKDSYVIYDVKEHGTINEDKDSLSLVKQAYSQTNTVNIGKLLGILMTSLKDRTTDFLVKMVEMYDLDRAQIFYGNTKEPVYFASQNGYMQTDAEYMCFEHYLSLFKGGSYLALSHINQMEYAEPEIYEEFSKKQLESIFQYVMLDYDNRIIGVISFEKCQKAVNWNEDIIDVFALVCAFLEKACERRQPGNIGKKDPLTSLGNKQSTIEEIDDFLHYTEEKAALLIIDVDNLNDINQTQGHLFGNQILVSVSQCLSRIFRNTDIIGRVGGDEFVAFMKDIDVAQRALSKAGEVCREVRTIYAGEDNKRITASVGIAVCPKDGREFQELFAKADAALSYVKNNAEGGYSLYDSFLHGAELEKGSRKLELEIEDREEELDGFYYKLTELTFRLMEETTDVESAVNLLLYKLKEHYHFNIVSIQEIAEKPCTMKCLYEIIDEGLPQKLGMDIVYNDNEWTTLYGRLLQGYAIYDSEAIYSGKKMDLYHSDGNIRTAITIPLTANQCIIGCVDFIDCRERRRFKDRDIQFLESFCRIIAVYMNRFSTIHNAKKIVNLMNERDALTGLYKYEIFVKKMEELQKSVDRVVYTYSDISHFKYINETYGYQVGDDILKEAVAKVAYGNPNLLCGCRIHSDNILTAINLRDRKLDTVVKIVNDMNQEMSNNFQRQYHDNLLSISSGMMLVENHSISVEEAISNANYARKEAKKKGDGKCVVFTETLMKEYWQKMQYIAELPDAIVNRELEVYIQPKVDAITKKTAGGEALIRWRRPDGRMIYPDQFIPIFESSGNIVELDYFVFREIFVYLRERLDKGLQVVPISLNVSRAHLNNDEILQYLDALFDKYRIDPGLVEFELTESIYIENVDRISDLLTWFKKRNIPVSMDDFGTGYSSLNVLSRIPIDVLKLDKIFLKDASLQENDRIIVSCIVNMAKQLHIKVVCEGVETKEQSDFLESIGCDLLQGFYYGKPMPIGEFDEFLNK